MKRININPDEVTNLFLTHSDSDHVGAVKLFKNAKIYLSKLEEQMINGKTSRFFIFKNKLDVKYELLEGNQVINLSDVKIKSISTPGHTPGAMCYLVNDKYIFIGDSMSLKNGEADLFNELFNMDPETQKLTIKKLAQLSGIKYIFTAHYGLSDNYEKTFKKWK